MAILRSALYMLLQIIITPPYALVTLACFPLSAQNRYRVTSSWTLMMLFLLRVICGIQYRVLGAEHIPKTPSIVLSKHQSAWETLAFQKIFPPQVWVLKKELLRIPFFGWGLAMTSPIAIDRSSGKAALEQVVEQGRDRLRQGFWVVIFPEGTRTPETVLGRFKRGAFLLAMETGLPILPVVMVNTDKIFRTPLRIKPNRVTVIIFKPVYYSDFKASLTPPHGTSDKQALNEFSESIRKTIQTGYDSHAT